MIINPSNESKIARDSSRRCADVDMGVTCRRRTNVAALRKAVRHGCVVEPGMLSCSGHKSASKHAKVF